MRNDVVAEIHDPSQHPVSIGLNFNGVGANGAPTGMNPTDVAGVQLQAHWNNITSNNGQNEEPLLDSLGEEALGLDDYEITIDFASSGNWGAGTGDANPTQRMLNGLIHSNPGSESYIQFEEVPEGTHTLIVYTVGIPLQFQDQWYKLEDIDGESIETIYTDQMNADQHNPIQRWFRGTSTDPNSRSLSNFVRFDNVQPSEGVVRFSWGTNTAGFDRGVSVNAVQLILNNPPLEIDPPSIVSNPEPTWAQDGSAAKLSVSAKGEGLTYQWLKNGSAIPNGGKVSGATSDTLTINGLTEEEVGFYNLAIFNDAGSVITGKAKLSLISSDAKMTDNLVTHIKFDESNGSSASNSGSDSFPVDLFDDFGDPYEEPTGSEGLIGKSITVNGPDQEAYAFGLMSNYTKITDEGSVSVWFNTSGLDSSAVILRNGSVLNRESENQFEIALNLNEEGDAFLVAAVTAGPNVIRLSDSEPIDLDEWNHAGLTIDGGQIRLYRNGNTVAVTDYLDRFNTSTENWVAVGANVIFQSGEFEEDPDLFLMDEANPLAFSGSIDDLAIWTVARSAADMKSIFEQGQKGVNASNVAVSIPDFVEPGEIDVTEPTIFVTRNADGSLTVEFEGTLQTAPTVNGPWTDVDATSPVNWSSDQAAGFARSKK